MKRSLDVLIMENRQGAAIDAEASLVAAGHRVHRCHHAGDRGFPCIGVSEPGACHIDRSIDVALLVRQRVAPRPAPLEEGVSCAIRAGVPLVEDGPDLLDPYGPWVTTRVTPDQGVEAACLAAVDASFDPLRSAIRHHIAGLLHADGMAADEVALVIRASARSLEIELTVPGVATSRFQQAVAVRVLDAVRDGVITYDQVDVRVVGR